MVKRDAVNDIPPAVKPVLHPWRAHAAGDGAIQRTGAVAAAGGEATGWKRSWVARGAVPAAVKFEAADEAQVGHRLEEEEEQEQEQAEEEETTTQPAARSTQSTTVTSVASLQALHSSGGGQGAVPKEHGKTMAQMAALAKPKVLGATPGADQDDFIRVMEDPDLHPNVSASSR